MLFLLLSTTVLLMFVMTLVALICGCGDLFVTLTWKHDEPNLWSTYTKANLNRTKWKSGNAPDLVRSTSGHILERCGGSEQKIPWVHASAYFKNGDERVSELE
jgi:hypothetical protein